MPRTQPDETAGLRLARELRDLKQRIRGLSITSEQEADTLRRALAELNQYVNLAIRVRVKPAADA